MKRTAVGLLAAGALAAIGTGVAAAPALASPGTPHKVTICHATGALTNPYVRITVDIASVTSFERDVASGHGTHDGPVFDPSGGKEQPAWGDIIPAFGPWQYRDDTVSYPGLNVPAGSAILENACKIPLPPPPATVYRPRAKFVGPCGDPLERVVYDNRLSTGSVTFRTYRAGALVSRTTLTIAGGASRTTRWFRVRRGERIAVRARGRVIATTTIGRSLRC